MRSPILKHVSSVFSLFILFILLLLVNSSHSANPPATTIITFETLSAPGSGTGGFIVRDQFPGIVFQPVIALDYSQGIPIPNFTHSGTKALQLCYAQEFCTSKLDITFNGPQRRVKIWVGYSGPLDSQQTVVMRAFDGVGNQLANDLKILGPSNGIIPIATPLEISLPSATVRRVTASFLGAEVQNPQIFNNGLAFDDLEFDDQVTAPQCPATQQPALTVNEPAQGRNVLENAFTLDANLTTPDPFATLQINVTGENAATRTFGPVFAASGHISIFNLSGLLFPGRNTLTIIARDCFGSRQVTRTVFFRTDVTRTSIRVINESGAIVPGAQVYGDGNYLGNTDQFGMVHTSPPLRSGVKLVARQFIKENSTYRKNHSKGSTKDWNFRVYISNIEVNNNGNLIFNNLVNYEPDPLAPQIVRVRLNNALFGLHVVASIEWDASAVEMEVVKQKLIAASKYLYNATDGQMLIEQAEVVDDAKYWTDADFRVYADQSLREHVNSPLGGFLSGLTIPGLPLPQLVVSRAYVQILSSGPTYAHEFAHYAFSVRDEYKDEHPEVHCTALLNDDTASNPFRNGSPLASCMMWSQHGTVRRKLCSGRTENPHVKGTRQGNSSCWSTLASHYKDSSNRWILKTPDTRGTIPGPINDGYPALAAWAPRIMFENNTRPNLCQPLRFKAAEKEREIWLETTYGADILEGKTDKDTGELTATGLHVGDNVEGLVIKPENCTPIAKAFPSPDITSPTDSAFALAHIVPITFFQNREGQSVLEIPSVAFNIFTVLKPTKGESAEISVRVEPSSGKEMVTLPKPPVVKILVREQEARYVPLRYHAGARAYVGTIEKLPIDTEVEIDVTATDQRKQTMHSVGRFRVSVPQAGYEMEVESPDGQLSLTIPAKALPRGARVVVGPPSSAIPPLPEGYSVLAGPISVWSSFDNRLYQPATLRLQLPHRLNDSDREAYAAKTLKVFHYDAENQKWQDIGGIVHPYPIDIVTVQTNRLGMFALVGMRTGKVYQRSALSSVMFKSISSFQFPDLLSMIFEH